MNREQGSMMSEAKHGMRTTVNAALAFHSMTCAAPARGDIRHATYLPLGEAMQ